MTATESLLPEIINDFFNKICQKLPPALQKRLGNRGPKADIQARLR